MFRIFYKVAFRNLLRHKGFSIINISGLTLGITACMLISLFLVDEREFDKFIPAGKRVYRIFYEITGEDGTSKVATTPPAFASFLQDNFPDVDKTMRVLNISSKELFQAGKKKMYEEHGIFADPNFFDVFPLSITNGAARDALTDPGSIVLSSGMAKKYFGSADPLGKQIMLGEDAFLVKAVFENNPKFHLTLNYILPLSSANLSDEQLKNWGWYGFYNYVQLKEGTDVNAFERKFQSHTRPFLTAEGPAFLPRFQPLHQVHLYSADFKYDMAKRGNITYIKALTIIACFILLIACFNFVNLSTAKSFMRAKEVGVLKTLGASKRQLLMQYTGETVLLTSICVLLSTLLTFLILPTLNNFTGKQISFVVFSNPSTIVTLLLLTILVGIVAGLYPAIVLSGFQPVKVLKAAVASDGNPGKTPWLRHVLVVIQFSLSVLLIIGAMVVIRQVNFLHNKDLGFDKEQVVFLPIRGEQMDKNYYSFKNQLKQIPGISAVTIGYGFPGDMFGDGPITVLGKANQQPLKATQLMVDEDYIKTLGLQLLAGRDFSRKLTSDQNAFILNETAVRDLGFQTPEKALGRTILWPTWANSDSVKKGQVIGVVKDFHYKSLYDQVEPAVLHIYPAAYSKMAIKIKTSGLENTIANVNKVWSRFSPDYPLEYEFMDENFKKMYMAEDRLKSLLWIFTGITIFVACLGLFGLAAYAAERRRKEIGIRKVLGASISGIILLLSMNFMKLVSLSLLIASPLAWYLMNEWLQNFAYRVELSWWIFGLSWITAILIALATVSYQAIKAAVSNPVESLRTE